MKEMKIKIAAYMSYWEYLHLNDIEILKLFMDIEINTSKMHPCKERLLP